MSRRLLNAIFAVTVLFLAVATAYSDDNAVVIQPEGVLSQLPDLDYTLISFITGKYLQKINTDNVSDESRNTIFYWVRAIPSKIRISKKIDANREQAGQDLNSQQLERQSDLRSIPVQQKGESFEIICFSDISALEHTIEESGVYEYSGTSIYDSKVLTFYRSDRDGSRRIQYAVVFGDKLLRAETREILTLLLETAMDLKRNCLDRDYARFLVEMKDELAQEWSLSDSRSQIRAELEYYRNHSDISQEGIAQMQAMHRKQPLMSISTVFRGDEIRSKKIYVYEDAEALAESGFIEMYKSKRIRTGENRQALMDAMLETATYTVDDNVFIVEMTVPVKLNQEEQSKKVIEGSQ